MKKTFSKNAEASAHPTTKPVSTDTPPTQQIAAAQKAVRNALREHKLAGNTIAVWRNGKVALVPADQIEV
jgi:hypothetical protein